MKKTRKVLALLLVMIMTVTLSVAGTIAYLKDTDEAANTMVLGNVTIDQHEYQRKVDDDGELVTEEIDGINSYVLENFEQDKPLFPAVIPNGGTVNGVKWDYDTTRVRMTQVDSYGTAQVFNTPNAQDKFVTVENTGLSDAYVRTIIAFEVGSAVLEDEENFKDQPLINSEMRVGEEADGVQPWTFGFVDEVEIAGNNWLVMELIYTGADLGDGTWRHENGVLPSKDTTYPNLCQVYMASRATNEDVEALDGNNNGEYDILVLSQAVQAAGFESPSLALDTAFGTVEENVATWMNDLATEVVPIT